MKTVPFQLEGLAQWWRHLGSPRVGWPAKRDAWLSPGERQAPPGTVSQLCYGDHLATLEE